MRKQLIISVLLVIVTGLKAQNIDSLKTALKTATSDTVRCDILNKLLESEPSEDVCTSYANEIVKITENKLQKFYQIALAKAYTNLGYYSASKANYAVSMDYISKALKIEEQIGDKKEMVGTLIVKGNVCEMSGELDYATNHFKKAYEISLEIKDKDIIANCLMPLGRVFYKKGEYDTAIDYFLKTKDISSNKVGVDQCDEMLAFVYRKKKDYAKALEYLKMNLKFRESEKDTAGISSTLQAIAHTYNLKQDFKTALPYAKRSFDLAIISNLPTRIMNSANTLRKAYTGTNQPAKALEIYEVYILTRDSIDSKANRKAVIKNQIQTEYEKKALADSLRVSDDKKITTLEMEKQQTQKTGLYIGLVLVLIFAGVMFNRFKLTQKQKAVIEVHQKEILDSITYAKRLQEAILPTEAIIKQHLPESFVLYKPKDIVAGDFYWMENIGDLVLFAAADCTGHGVPGAMMSVVCSNALNRSVREFGLTIPGAILDKTRELVIATFEKSGEAIKDGMDISLCCLNTRTNELLWAGANNPLWYVQDGKLNEVKADKQPIGHCDNQKPFTTHSVLLQKGDTAYIFTDGYADQFGGPKGKKFKYKQLENTLLNGATDGIEKGYSAPSMFKQRTNLSWAFDFWKGELEQVDDVCVIGVKIQ